MPLKREKILSRELYVYCSWVKCPYLKTDIYELKHDMLNKQDIDYPLALSHRKAYVGQTVIAYFKLLVLAVIYLF